MIELTDRQWDLIEISLEASANACQAGATMTGKGTDPLAREYLTTQRTIEAWREGGGT